LALGPEAVGKDKHVAELVFACRDRTEGRVALETGTEVDPEEEQLALGSAGLASGGLGSGLQSSAEVKAEEVSGGRCKSSQGAACG
jgi:hypothetical protein